MTRYVYILIAHENNNYAAMCLISALSVRGVDADAQVTVLSDGPTLAMLHGCRHQLLEVADEVLDCGLNEPPKIASRILKTTLLQRLQSDFIFLDVDTIVVRPIAQRLRQAHSIQMALDRAWDKDTGLYHLGLPKWAIPYYQQLDWPWPPRHYFNSGVMLVRADDAARRLFEEWHRRWQAFQTTGCHLDQPALNCAIEACRLEVGQLPLPYNAVVRVNESYRWRARVIHFYAEGLKLDEGTEYARLADCVTSGRRLTSQEVRKAVLRRWPLVEAWKLHRHLKAGSFPGMWMCYRERRHAKNQHTKNQHTERPA